MKKYFQILFIIIMLGLVIYCFLIDMLALAILLFIILSVGCVGLGNDENSEHPDCGADY